MARLKIRPNKMAMSKDKQNAGHAVLSQILSLIPREFVNESVAHFQSDRYYKKMSTYKQLVFLLYGVITKAHSLNSLCKSLLFLTDKLSHLGITEMPARSTLSDANINRNSDVFGMIYSRLLGKYRNYLRTEFSEMFHALDYERNKVQFVDSTTVSLFTDLFKGAGRNPVHGKKKAA